MESSTLAGDIFRPSTRLTNSHFARQRKRLSSVMPIKARSPKNPFNYRSCRGGKPAQNLPQSAIVLGDQNPLHLSRSHLGYRSVQGCCQVAVATGFSFFCRLLRDSRSCIRALLHGRFLRYGSVSRIAFRALARRDITVPIGVDSISAISRQDAPST